MSNSLVTHSLGTMPTLVTIERLPHHRGPDAPRHSRPARRRRIAVNEIASRFDASRPAISKHSPRPIRRIWCKKCAKAAIAFLPAQTRFPARARPPGGKRSRATGAKRQFERRDRRAYQGRSAGACRTPRIRAGIPRCRQTVALYTLTPLPEGTLPHAEPTDFDAAHEKSHNDHRGGWVECSGMALSVSL